MDWDIETCDIEPGTVYHLGAVAFYQTPSGEYGVIDWTTGRARLVKSLAIVSGPAADIGGGFGQADEKGRWLVDAAYNYPPSVSILRRFAVAQTPPAAMESLAVAPEDQAIASAPPKSSPAPASSDPEPTDDDEEEVTLDPAVFGQTPIPELPTADGGTLADDVSVQKE